MGGVCREKDRCKMSPQIFFEHLEVKGHWVDVEKFPCRVARCNYQSKHCVACIPWGVSSESLCYKSSRTNEYIQCGFRLTCFLSILCFHWDYQDEVFLFRHLNTSRENISSLLECEPRLFYLKCGILWDLYLQNKYAYTRRDRNMSASTFIALETEKMS